VLEHSLGHGQIPTNSPTYPADRNRKELAVNIVPGNSTGAQIWARKHFDVGYALYMANQPMSACQNDDQCRGWNNAQRGHMAAVNAEVECYLAEQRGW
jgi:hypothetical protein